MSKYNELVKKLKEIFQIDRPELDFGIYRILNAKSDEINDYLENTLKKKISDALATAGNANKEELESKLDKIIKTYQELEEDPFEKPKVKDLQNQIATLSQGANEHENAVFTHLLSFFSRYYDSGDFVSKRRYKGDTYAIPYAGEEVMLHWANKDQYYIKSGENFANYTFKLDDGRKVTFKLTAADMAKDNRKDNEADRRFALVEPHTRTQIDDDGFEYEEEFHPVTFIKSGNSDELVVLFEYKTVKKGTKQEALLVEALQTVLAHEQIQTEWVDITKREPTEKNPNRTLLEKHLTTYTQRNTADYFIHKDLGGFLANELDFYIKNEVMNLDNVQNAEVFADIEKQLRMIQCLRSISTDIISFLSQLENFQKKLWTKKKFVVNSYYCITLDLIDPKYYPEIVENPEQWQQWQSMGLWASSASGSIDDLHQNQFLLVDTSLFNTDFKIRVLSDIADLDEKTNGTLINSENFQAASLLQSQYVNKADLVYLDPPYNTDATPILYKNGYKESSWATLMADRINLSTKLLNQNGVIAYAIDDTEASLLKEIEKQLNPNREVFQCIVEHYPGSGTGRSNVSRTHEYCIFSVAGNDDVLRGDSVEDGIRTRGFRRAGTGDNNFRIGNPGRPESFFAVLVDQTTYKVMGVETPPPPVEKGNYPLEDTAEGYKRVYPIGEKGIERVWSLSYEGAKKAVEEERLVSSSNFVINRIYHDEARRLLLPSVWQGSQYNATTGGTNLLTNLFGDAGRFSYPKSLGTMSRVLESVVHDKKSSLTVDLFGGSGTTAHAIIERNRVNEENHKYILVEMGSHSDYVIKERISKVTYSSKWKNGRPLVDNSGSSHCLKVIKLESYEDTLNNLKVKLPGQQLNFLNDMPEEIKEEYLLNYMLETESKESLLSTDDFKKPFDYKMKITVDSAGAYEDQNIDLVETFNYLIGLQVKTIESNLDRGYMRIEGKLPNGDEALILWRDCDKWTYDKFSLETLKVRFDLNPKEKQFDVIYVNGDHNLPTAFTTEDGDVTRTLKLRQIESEFLEQMFAPDELT